MFYVQDATQINRIYQAGSIRSKRTVKKVSAIDPVPGSSEGPANVPEEEQDLSRQGRINAYQQVHNQQNPQRRIVYAEELMTKEVQTIVDTLSIQETWNLFTNRRFRHIPILNSNHKLVGIVSDRDVLKYVAGSIQTNEKNNFNQPISTIMATEVLTASADTNIREIAKVLFEERIGCMPITDEAGKICGMITRSDILRVLLIRAPLELWS